MSGSELLTNFLKEPVVMHLTQISGLDLKGIHLATSGSRADRRNPFFASDLQDQALGRCTINGVNDHIGSIEPPV